MRFLITAGPTREFLDDVRFLGNPSTGSMGLAVAEAAVARGHEATVVLGPTTLPDPPRVTVHRVVSARGMHAAVMERVADADACVMTAAVCDYRPRARFDGKIKKGSEELTLELVKNPDILAEVGRMAAGRALVGFALEAAPPDEALKLARDKLRRKRCDLVVLNRPGSFASTSGEDVVLVTEDEAVVLGHPTKRDLAERLVRFCESGGASFGDGK